MPLHKDFIKKTVKEAVEKHNVSVPPEELEKVLSSAIYNILYMIACFSISYSNRVYLSIDF